MCYQLLSETETHDNVVVNMLFNYVVVLGSSLLSVQLPNALRLLILYIIVIAA